MPRTSSRAAVPRWRPLRPNVPPRLHRRSRRGRRGTVPLLREGRAWADQPATSSGSWHRIRPRSLRCGPTRTHHRRAKTRRRRDGRCAHRLEISRSRSYRCAVGAAGSRTAHGAGGVHGFRAPQTRASGSAGLRTEGHEGHRHRPADDLPRGDDPRQHSRRHPGAEGRTAHPAHQPVPPHRQTHEHDHRRVCRKDHAAAPDRSGLPGRTGDRTSAGR